jgi:DNA-3-methyladenine glycosylase I
MKERHSGVGIQHSGRDEDRRMPNADPRIPLHYCDLARGHPVHGPYHDCEYGFPQTDERVLLERLALEIMQAGLSWEIVLKKRAALRRAFAAYRADVVAAFGVSEVERLLADSTIIRNRRKIEAIIENARRIVALRTQGGFARWLQEGAALDRPAWLKRLKAAFVFMGPEIAGEFLMSLGLLPGAHRDGCPVGEKLKKGGTIRRSAFRE